jgi:AcrR family transcriptional regulator
VSPRARHDEADILDATIRVIAERGVAGATVDTVAARAGVSKATIYRHWGSRARLIHAALSSLEGPYVETEGDTLREDLIVLLWHLVEFFNRPDIGRVFASFIDAAARDPELAELHQQTVRRARASFVQVVRRGIARGELPADVDVDLFIDVVRSPFIYRRVVAQSPVHPADIEPVVDLVLGAFSPVPK